MSNHSPAYQQNVVDDYPPPPPATRGRSPGARDRSLSPRRRSSSRERYYEDSRPHYRDDEPRYSRDRYEGSRRDYYYEGRGGGDRYYNNDRYDRYERRGGYDRYDDRRGRYPPKPRQRRPVDRGTEQDRKNTSTIYAGNLPYDFIERDVAAMFERYGRIKSITVPLDQVTHKNKGFAFVEFEDRRDAEDAFEKFDGFSVEGRRLRLDWDIGLGKKGENRPPRRGPPPPPMDGHRDRSEPYASLPPPPPPMDSRVYKRESPEPYRR